jgi:hypothetical protein
MVADVSHLGGFDSTCGDARTGNGVLAVGKASGPGSLAAPYVLTGGVREIVFRGGCHADDSQTPPTSRSRSFPQLAF